MCCFSGPVNAVGATRIFARLFADGRQALAYGADVDAPAELAMVLPLPVAPGSGEAGVTFVDLSGYPGFFAGLAAGFGPLPGRGGVNPVPASAPTPLRVHDVGDFVASYVPTIADFARLDQRFRLPEGTWERLPGYRDHGFAVFTLKPGLRSLQPMAFTFPSANPDKLFFPTVHIHDGAVHERADFDHELYLQPGGGVIPGTGWDESRSDAQAFIAVDRAKGLVDGERHVYRATLRGSLPNRDTWA
ncbi:MAG: hypothetical protein H0W72_13395 [Planctomycetes bacterium]|nr:hypothetical protein [Planctomycetota bacterium]